MSLYPLCFVDDIRNQVAIEVFKDREKNFGLRKKSVLGEQGKQEKKR